MSTVTHAVARTGANDERFQALREVIRTYAPSFERVLPSQIRREQFVASATAMLQRSPELRDAAMSSPDSFIHALMDCATKGHLPGDEDLVFCARHFSIHEQALAATRWNKVEDRR